ncbi:MAG: MFS transporter [Pseudomonadota bacterium]
MLNHEVSRFVLDATRAHPAPNGPGPSRPGPNRPGPSRPGPSRTGYFYGYNIIAACSVIQFMFLGTLFSFGVLFPELEREFGWSRATISGAFSAALFLMGALAILMGRINDRIGPRTLLSVAGILYGIGYVSLYTLQSPWQLYLFYGLLLGIGMGAHDVGTLSTAARWFAARRGAMSGIVKAGAGGGQLVIPLIAASLLPWLGWRTTSVVIGVAAMVIIVAASQLLRRDPAVMGLSAYGASTSDETGEQPIDTGLTLRDATKTRAFWLLCLAKFADLVCLMTVITHIVPYGIDRGLAPSTAATVLSAIGGVSIVGRLVVGAGYDRFGARRALMFCFTLLGLSLVLLQFAASAPALFLFATIYGVAHGGFFTIASPAAAEYFGTRAHGAILGAVFFGGSVGATLGPILAGRLFDTTGSYSIAFYALLGFSVVGVIAAFALPRLRPTRTAG